MVPKNHKESTLILHRISKFIQETPGVSKYLQESHTTTTNTKDKDNENDKEEDKDNKEEEDDNNNLRREGRSQAGPKSQKLAQSAAN